MANPEDTYNTQIGLAIRRSCSGILDLPRHASPADYWSRRSELGELEVSRRMTRAAGVSDWLIDTGLDTADYLGPGGMADVSGGRTHEIIRLEVVAESLIQEIASPGRLRRGVRPAASRPRPQRCGRQNSSRLPRRIRPESQPTDSGCRH